MFKPRETVFLPCKLTLSGFSSERVFRITQADDSVYVGAAPVHYCWTEDGKRLGEGEPAHEESLAGLVQGLVIANGGERAKVQIPDGELIQVWTSIYKRRPEVDPEPYFDVPI